MKILRKDDDNQYLDYADVQLIPELGEFLIESHRPTKFRSAYHHHASVEINYLTGCDMEYSFSGTRVRVPREQMTIFWGAVPHGVTDVWGRGDIVNIYISLAQILKWGLPKAFVDSLIAGSVLTDHTLRPSDPVTFQGWAHDYARGDSNWKRLLLGEIEMRLRRMALQGYTSLKDGMGSASVNVSGVAAMRYIDEMLRFIADRYVDPISVADVADAVNLSPSYSMSLFRRAVGVPIKEHITRIRLSHAQMLLANSDVKILSVAMDSGFGSLSSFYEAFQSHAHQTPAAFRRETRQ